ncbi:MAG: hypothetical protein ACOZNI_28055 [Myxococcota bacterium]
MSDTRNLEFEGLDRLDAVILKLRDDIGYVSVEEVLTRNKTEMVGRAEFSITELAAFVGSKEDEEEDETEDDGAPPSLGDLSAPLTGPTAEDLAVAMTRFVRHTIAANMTGCPRRIFKVSVWRPKGGGQYRSGRVVCTDPDFDEGEDLGFDEPASPAAIAAVPTQPPAPAPTVVAPPVHLEFLPEARPWRALSDAYTNLIGLLQTSYNHLANLQTATIDGQNKQNIRLHRVMEALVTELTNLRLGLTEQADERRQEDQKARLHAELGKQFFEQLGSVGRAYVSSKSSLPPELAPLAEALMATPELMEVIRSPEGQALLNDPATRLQLAGILKFSAQRNAEREAAARAQPAAPRPPDPDPPLADDPPAA